MKKVPTLIQISDLRAGRFYIYLLIVLGCVAILSSPTCVAQGTAVAIIPEKSHIDFTVSDTVHTVHGTFQVKEGKLTLDQAKQQISGSLLVDVRSGNSGNRTRDRKMHKEILESERYPVSTFTAESMEGNLAGSGDSEVKVHGKLNLHGADHPMTLDIQVNQQGNIIIAKTKFGIPFVEWGMKDPSNFFIRLKKTVQMDIEISGSIQK
jgi:polyisoprenoid-binding protein YceI